MMKRMMRWMAAGLAMVSGLMFLRGEPAASQVARTGQAVSCPVGMEEGDLGISGLDCVGECTLIIRDEGRDRSWSFSTEPRVFGIQKGGPADGILRSGDLLVAIDGVLITTREGGRRYANLEPGERVTVRFRRDGRVREAEILVAAGCLDAPEPTAVSGRVPPPPPLPDQATPTRGVAVSPRVRVAPERQRGAAVEGVPSLSTGLGRARSGLLTGRSPTGQLGVGFSCQVCGTKADEETGEEVWFFSGPLEVTLVNPGGPADDVGILRGDLIKAIDGKSVDTEAGGLAFTRITPGKEVRLTLVKRNGSEVDVSVVPQEEVTAVLSRERRTSVGLEPRAGVSVPSRARTARGVAEALPSPPAVPDVAAPPAGVASSAAPEGMPLRYLDVVEGVEVEVRGIPITVSEMSGARTLYINAEGLWIRITVPRRRLVSGGEGQDSTIP